MHHWLTLAALSITFGVSDPWKAVGTTTGNKAAPLPLDQVNRQFPAPAPNMLCVSDQRHARFSPFGM